MPFLRCYPMDPSLSVSIILKQIEQSPLRNIPNLLSHILHRQIDYAASTAAIKSPHGTHCILNALLHACRPTVVQWAINISQDTYRNEIIRASDITSGLHFNASHAHSAELEGFDMKEIAGKFESAAPLTWSLVQTLLDANGVARCHKQAMPIGDGIENVGSAINEDTMEVPDIGNRMPEGDHVSDSQYEHTGESEKSALLRIDVRFSRSLQIVQILGATRSKQS